MLDYIVKIIDSIAWPVAVIWLGYLFRSEFKALLGRISSLKYKDIEANFKNELIQLESEAKQITAKSYPTQIPIEDGNKRYYRLMRLAETSPRAAVLEAWIEVETELLNLCNRFGFKPTQPKNSYSVVREMVANDILPENILSLIDNLRKLRNDAVHLPEFGFDDESKRYLSVAIGIANMLETIEKKT